MTLNSLSYIGFLLAVVLIYYILPAKYRWLILLGASYLFYFLSSSNLVIFLLISTISIYVAGLLINKQNNRLNEDLSKEEKKILKANIKHKKKIILIITIILNFGILGILKYLNFFGRGINNLLDLINLNYDFPSFKFILPLGISYYTLQAVSYIVDVYRGKYEATTKFREVALFTSFFPSITEGPIGRFDHLQPQFATPAKFNLQNILLGSTLILIGFAKKMVIADRVGIFVNEAITSGAGGITIFLIAVFYTIQIYAEFSGCMNIVSGSAKMFNINLANNFNQPFFAKSIQEFWQRWHITLGAWIKDYIFYPISLSKISTKVSMAARKHLIPSLAKFIVVAFPLFFVWLFNGIWHGASLKYVTYGMYYYFIMMLGLLFAPLSTKILSKLKIDQNSKIYHAFQIIRTCIFVAFGMLLFRSASVSEFVSLLKSMISSPSIGILNFSLVPIDFLIIVISVLIIFIVDYLKEKNIDVYTKFSSLPWLVKLLSYLVIILIIIVFGIYGEGYNVSDFIYGEF